MHFLLCFFELIYLWTSIVFVCISESFLFIVMEAFHFGFYYGRVFNVCLSFLLLSFACVPLYFHHSFLRQRKKNQMPILTNDYYLLNSVYYTVNPKFATLIPAPSSSSAWIYIKALLPGMRSAVSRCQPNGGDLTHSAAWWDDLRLSDGRIMSRQSWPISFLRPIYTSSKDDSGRLVLQDYAGRCPASWPI